MDGSLLRVWMNERMRSSVVALGCALLLAVGAGGQATGFADAPPVMVGAAWYPEQWPEARWDADLRLMEQANIHVVRVGEFAWSTMEPAEGKYDFRWLDHAIERAAAHHIYVVLGTPTATPPAWLTRKYPEVLRIDEQGRRDEHGNRQQASYANPKYRELCRGIVEQMARRYGRNANVVGWQIDNELGPISYDDAAKTQWHGWLRAKYGSIAELNRRWTTAYWSQTYDDFDEVPAHGGYGNPGLALDYHRFVTDTYVSYTENQVKVLKQYRDPRQFITTNTMGWFDAFDHYKLHALLDIAAWDDYVGKEKYDPADNAWMHDLERGFKGKNFWVMETQPAFVNWKQNNVALNRGQMRERAWQAVGHGAEVVEYWQWRSALNGQETYHGTLVGADGTPVPVYEEVKQIGAEFSRAGAVLAGTTPVAKVAMLHSYESRWAIDQQRHNANFTPADAILSFYRPLLQQAQVVDVISQDAPLERYALVVAPALNVLPAATAARLRAYVEAGGHLVLGTRSGMKDEWNALHVERQPGPLVEVLGARVEQFYALDQPVNVSGDAGVGTAMMWAEALSVRPPEGGVQPAQVVARYGSSNGWLDGQPAIVTRKVGAGRITYVGAQLDDGLMARLTQGWLQDAQVAPRIAQVPAGVEVCVRSGQGRDVVVLVNHTTMQQTVRLPQAMTDVLEGGKKETVSLPKYGVAVLEGKL